MDYYQLCQGENTPKELYFYYKPETTNMNLFVPILGSFESYFIEENIIKNISDLNFNKIKAINFFYISDKTGYLNIKCKEPTMIKRIIIGRNFDYVLNSGNKYYYDGTNKYNFTLNFDKSLLNKVLNLKFNVYGIDPSKTIKLILNKKTYSFKTDSPLELNYTFIQEEDNCFIQLGEIFKDLMFINVIVGFLPEEFSNIYKEIDFINAIGSLNIEKNKGLAIKIPKEFKNDLYTNYSIIFLNNRSHFIISYDRLELQVPDRYDMDNNPVIQLFKVNPYDYIKEDFNKYFYILIFNSYYDNCEILIKKPKIYYDIELNKINILPKLTDDNKKYYYQIQVPKGNYNSFSIQTIYNKDTKFSFSKNTFHYTILDRVYGGIKNEFYFNMPLNTKNSNDNTYFNYYDKDYSDGFINIIEEKEYFFTELKKIIELEPNIEQISGKNKIKIKINSLSFCFYPNVIKYYILINIEENIPLIYSIITKKKRDK